MCVLIRFLLCHPMDCNVPGSSVHGILRARILNWVAILPPGDLLGPVVEPAFPMAPALVGGFFTTEPPGKPQTNVISLQYKIKCFLPKSRNKANMSTLVILIQHSAGSSSQFSKAGKGC